MLGIGMSNVAPIGATGGYDWKIEDTVKSLGKLGVLL